MEFKLTPDQDQAYKNIQAFFKDEDNPAIVIMGSAGTGKTFLTRYIVDYILNERMGSIAAIAPTHKARRVLEKTLNTERFFPVPSFTVASILGKMREHSYIGSHKYTNGSKQKMDKFDYFILDEVSMVEDKDLEEIIDYICEHDKKLILVGDNCQIPCPSQIVVREGDICYKPDSVAFTIANICVLNNIVRQAADSPIIRIASYLRNNLLGEVSINDILTGSQVSPEEITISCEEAYSQFIAERKANLDVRMIAYTNASIRSHNTRIRRDLGIEDKLIVVDELLTGYNNVGWPTAVIENGTDYKVSSLRPTSRHMIGNHSGLVGDLVDLVDMVDQSNISRDLFFINVRHSHNVNFMKEFVKRAERVNKRYSTKDAYRKYCALKNKAVFLEDVYNYCGKIMTEADLKQAQPLLFTKVKEVIDTTTKAISVSDLTDKLRDTYGEIIEGRLIDNKPFADGEVFADQYMVVEKDIYYGYAMTAHKSQGSTYDSVYVDENDFNKISDRWNYKLRAMEHRFKEKNQLKYVACTRASKKLRIIV